MAMPRSPGSTRVTSWSSIQISPSVTSSRPAIIRIMVVLPQPEGPTSTVKEPSWMSMFMFSMTVRPLGYVFFTFFREITGPYLRPFLFP